VIFLCRLNKKRALLRRQIPQLRLACFDHHVRTANTFMSNVIFWRGGGCISREYFLVRPLVPTRRRVQRAIVASDHTHWHPVGRVPMDEGPARRRGLYLHDTQHSQETVYDPDEIRTRSPRKRAAADRRLRPRGHRERRNVNRVEHKSCWIAEPPPTPPHTEAPASFTSCLTDITETRHQFWCFFVLYLCVYYDWINFEIA
jgi:hypothetical protein